MVFTPLFLVTKCYADFGVKKYADSLQTELHYWWIAVMEGRKKKKDKSEILSTVLSGLSVMENCN